MEELCSSPTPDINQRTVRCYQLQNFPPENSIWQLLPVVDPIADVLTPSDYTYFFTHFVSPSVEITCRTFTRLFRATCSETLSRSGWPPEYMQVLSLRYRLVGADRYGDCLLGFYSPTIPENRIDTYERLRLFHTDIDAKRQ